MKAVSLATAEGKSSGAPFRRNHSRPHLLCKSTLADSTADLGVLAYAVRSKASIGKNELKVSRKPVSHIMEPKAKQSVPLYCPHT